MKIKKNCKMTAMLFALIMVFNFTTLNLLAEVGVPETITITSLNKNMPNLSLDVNAANVDILQIKMIMTPNIYSRTGTCTYSSIETVAIGTKVALSCLTDGAFIIYSINDGVDAEYNPSEQITLDTLPASIKAYAEKNGQKGNISTFNYTLNVPGEGKTLANASAAEKVEQN